MKNNPGAGFPYSAEVKKIFAGGREEAVQYKSEYVETEHLLLGLLRVSFLLASRFNISEAAVRERLGPHKAPSADVPMSEEALPPLSFECKEILAYAVDEAQKHGDESLASEHLLLGMLVCNGYYFAREFLNGTGLEAFAVREQLWRKQSSSEPKVEAFSCKIAPVGAFPELEIFYAKIAGGETTEGTYHDRFGSKGELQAFLRGVQAGTSRNGGTPIAPPSTIEEIETKGDL